MEHFWTPIKHSWINDKSDFTSNNSLNQNPHYTFPRLQRLFSLRSPISEQRIITASSTMRQLAIFAALLVLLLTIYCKLDPFHLSPIYGIPNFHTFKVHMPHWSQIPKARDPHNLLRNSQIKFFNQVQGPESLAFDPLSRGPYTGVADGRILFWNGGSWSYFAHTSPNRSEAYCGFQRSMLDYRKNEHICGRPLGLRFDKKSGDLYIADAYFGLLKVGPEGGLATSLSTEAEGVPFMFTNDLDIDDDDGNVYFTDSSSIYERRNFELLIYSGVASGRVLKYDPMTKLTTVLMRNMVFPNGLSLSKDGRFFVFTEAGILRRYWLKGEQAGTSDIFALLPGSPDNVRTNENGEFRVAIPSFHNKLTLFSAEHPKFRLFTLKLPIPANWQSWIYRLGAPPGGIVVKYSSEGELVEIMEDKGGEVVRLVSEVHEHDGSVWMGSVYLSRIAIYNLTKN